MCWLAAAADRVQFAWLDEDIEESDTPMSVCWLHCNELLPPHVIQYTPTRVSIIFRSSPPLSPPLLCPSLDRVHEVLPSSRPQRQASAAESGGLADALFLVRVSGPLLMIIMSANNFYAYAMHFKLGRIQHAVPG